MKLGNVRNQKGFTLSEMLIALSIAAVALAGTISASVGLQKSMNAVDNYFTAHVQQIRIVDYLSRDVKRSYIVTSTGSPQTVTCTTPDYLDSSGARRTPKITMNANGATVDYRAAVSDGVLVSGSSIFTSATAGFTSADVGKALIGTDIPIGTTIQSYTGPTTVVMSANATTSSTSETVAIGNIVLYSISGQSILRTENGALTTIASSTDNLLPSSLDIELANTEYLTTSITFLPIFTSGGATAERSGTTIYSTAYLRNKRRG
jgi:prepilin-type N-terminal cleavage/methylation domain-containing protein